MSNTWDAKNGDQHRTGGGLGAPWSEAWNAPPVLAGESGPRLSLYGCALPDENRGGAGKGNRQHQQAGTRHSRNRCRGTVLDMIDLEPDPTVAGDYSDRRYSVRICYPEKAVLSGFSGMVSISRRD